MDINCNKSNKRVYARCLKDWLNGLRQSQNMTTYKTIAKFKKQFNVATAKDAYRVAEDLYETRRHKYKAFEDLNDLRNIISTFGGKTIRVMYIVPASPVLGLVGGTVVDVVYDVPANELQFVEWWLAKVWDWRVSDVTIFSENSMLGDVFITERLNLTPQHVSQSYLDNETQNCIFSPILAVCEKNINNPELAPSTQSKYKTIINKVNKLMPQYVNGVPDEKLDEVFRYLKICMTLTLPFSEKRKIHFGEQNKKKYTMALNYINTRLDHLEVAGEYYNNDKPIVLDEEEFNNLHYDLVSNNKFFIYQTTNSNVYSLKTLNNNYKLLDNRFDVFNEFEKENGMNNYCVDDVKDELLSNFIRCSAHLTCSRINPKFKDDLVLLQDKFKEIDGVKAYSKFRNCNWFQGFVGKITDFRKTDKIEGLGLYLIGNIDWTNANQQVKLIQQTFHLYYGRNVYTSPELEFLTDNGVTFKIYGGAWGVKMDFEFSEKMYNKQEKIPNYSRWTGMCISDNKFDTYNINTDQVDYANNLIKSAECSANYSDGVVTFSVPKEKRLHKGQIASFIFAYQRINLMEQLMKMDISKVIRINTDGIKYISHDFTINEIFKEVKNPNVNGLLMGEHEDTLLSNINNCDPYYWFQFHLHFLKTKSRSHYDNELYLGRGGSGKTHINLTDNGLIKPLYVATSYKLTRAKQLGYTIDTEVLANLISPMRKEHILKNYNTIIVDEASMVSEEIRKFIFTTYKQCKLVFCGDIGYQCDPIEGSLIEITAFQNIITMLINYRCKDEQLDNILNDLRTAIETKIKNVIDIITPIQTISKAELVKKYDVHDIILTHTLKTQDEYNQLLKDKEKYVIVKSTDDYSRGEIFYDKPSTKHMELRHGYTTHSVQGETFYDNIYIDKEVIANKKLLYTALSRAEYLHQLHFITDN